MKIAIITGNKLHHKYFIKSMCTRFDVRLVFVPRGKATLRSATEKKIFRYGFTWAVLKLLSLTCNLFVGSSMVNSLKKKEKEYFSDYKHSSEDLPGDIFHYPDTINCKAAIDLVKKQDIDVLCFLGGDIAGSEFISSAKLCSLNYHSGLSPLYNGNKTTFHPVAESRPNFTGGTLMYISERIDGGKILAHYMPEIMSGDKAADLFMKGIWGAVKLYTGFLEHISSGVLPSGVLQHRSFRYVRNIDWTILQDIRLRKFERSGLMKRYERKEEVKNYFHLGEGDIVKIYPEILNSVLKKSK